MASAFRIARLSLFAGLLWGFYPASALADDGSTRAPGPQKGAGERAIDAEKSERRTSAIEPATEAAPPKTHKVGRPPRKPAARLPQGVPEPAADRAARQRVANGPLMEELGAGANDPELQALHEAEKVLFPEQLDGLEPGWSWELPQQDKPAVGLSASGVPPSELAVTEPKSDALAEAEWLSNLARPNIGVRLDQRVVKYLKFYRDSAKGRTIATIWARKSGRYAPALRAEFAKAGLPSDLIWLSLIESGHNPTVHSPAGAAGLWQFIPSSARMYGLTVDRWVDERLDPERSTEAAIRYLSDLHRRFGNWELAMAGYNMGHGGLSRTIEKYNSNDYWQLGRYEAGIPWETALYVPKIAAIATVMKNKAAFGIDHVTPDPPVAFDKVLVKPSVSLEEVARAAGVSATVVQELNAQYLAHRTPPAKAGEPDRSWPVKVPLGHGIRASEQLAKSNPSDEKYEPYLVRFGDTLETIAADLGTNELTLRTINRTDRSERLGAGTVILVPKERSGHAAIPESEEVLVAPPKDLRYPGKRRVFYRIIAGDTLSSIAHAFDVSRHDLMAWNTLDERARLASGMTLQLFVDESAKLERVRHLEEDSRRVLAAGSEEFFDYFEGRKGKKRMVLHAKGGEKLRAIASRYGMSSGWAARVNRRSRNDILKAGEAVVVYVDRNHPAQQDQPARAGQDVTPPVPSALPAIAEEATAPSETAAVD